MIFKEWKHNGLNCCIREGLFGTYNGYVQDPTNGKLGDDVHDFEVHGGITWYAPLEQEDLETMWLGFDTCHAGDFSDMLVIGRKPRWTLEMVEQETNSLADQIAQKVKRG